MASASAAIIDEIVNARVSMLFQAPFFGNIALRLKLVDATRWCKTAATDGRALYFSKDFLATLNRQELIFLVAHEVGHCIYDHFGRRGNRDPNVWNIANDYIVNYTLVKNNIGTMPKVGLYSEKYTDLMTSEEVYDDLMKSSTKVRIKLKTLDEHLQLGKDKGDGKGKGKGKDKGDPQEGDDDGEGDQEVDVTVMNPGMNGEDGPPELTEEDLEQIRNELRASMLAAAAASAGNVPAGIRRLIDSMVKPVLDWKTLLRDHLMSAVKNDYTFVRPNKRSWALGCILPGMLPMETIDIEILIDTSGSISNDILASFLSEIRSIFETFPDFTAHVSTFDTKVYNRQKFTPENLEDITEYEAKGGGGTSFQCCWDYMRAEGIEPRRVVLLTDGLTGDTWGDDTYPTLFVIYGNPAHNIEGTHGQTAYLDPED